MSLSDRRDEILQKGVVAKALPEHFTRYYPNLIAFLDAYYEFMGEDNTHDFDKTISNIIKSHDFLGVDISLLDQLMASHTLGVNYSTALSDARIKAQLFGRWYRTKGSLYSLEVFFRWLYGEDVIVEYGKDKVFYLNHAPSQIGPLSLRFIKNDKLYQTFALLIKLGIPLSTWRDSYKELAHPAGMYFEGQVVIESAVDLGVGSMPVVILDSDAGTVRYELEGVTLTPTTFSNITGLYPDDSDSDADQQRVEFNKTVDDLVSTGLTLTDLNALYRDIEDVIDANSPSFDEEDSSPFVAVRLSNTIETMDEDVFDLLQIDSDKEFSLADSDNL